MRFRTYPAATRAAVVAPVVTVLGSLLALTAAAAFSPTRAAPNSPIDMTGWTPFFYDDFTGDHLDTSTSHWKTYDYGPSNWDMQWNPEGISVNNGLTLKIWWDGSHWNGPGLRTHQGLVFYRAEIKAKVPAALGLGPYLVMWPQNDDWPPEFDILETPGDDPHHIMTTWHWRGPRGNANYYTSEHYSVDDTARWHVYTVEHTAKGFRFWIDGVAQAVPSSWNRHNDTTHVMTFGIGTFVARADTKDTWFGPPPNPASSPYFAHVAYVAMWQQ
jgi:hypothetical protein